MHKKYNRYQVRIVVADEIKEGLEHLSSIDDVKNPASLSNVFYLKAQNRTKRQIEEFLESERLNMKMNLAATGTFVKDGGETSCAENYIAKTSRNS